MENKWQPIETAPMDETWVLGWDQWKGRPQIVQAEEDAWFNEDGNELLDYPTHWMPLPAPPQEPETGGAE